MTIENISEVPKVSKVIKAPKQNDWSSFYKLFSKRKYNKHPTPIQPKDNNFPTQQDMNNPEAE